MYVYIYICILKPYILDLNTSATKSHARGNPWVIGSFGGLCRSGFYEAVGVQGVRLRFL